MSNILITKTTKNTVYASITTKNSKTVKVIIKNWITFNDACGYLINKSDIKVLLDSVQNLLSAKELQDIKKHYFPTTTQVKKVTENKKKREQWFIENEKMLDAQTEKMASHPGFMGKNQY